MTDRPVLDVAAVTEEIERVVAALRDHFAAAALTGIVDRAMLAQAMTAEACELEIANAAALAYRLADAMLAQRVKTALW